MRAEERRNRKKVSLIPNNTGLRGKKTPWGSLAIFVIQLSLFGKDISLNTGCIIYKNQFLGDFFWFLLSFIYQLFVCLFVFEIWALYVAQAIPASLQPLAIL